MKRILSLLLCLALCLTLVPAGAALAEGEDLPLEEVTDEELIEILDETEDDEIVVVDEDGTPIEESGTGEAAAGPIGEKSGFGYDCLHIEPLYRNVISEEQLAAKLDSISAFVPADELESEANAVQYCKTFSSAASYLKNQMLGRNENISFKVPVSVIAQYDNPYLALYDAATAHVDGSSGREGDALRWGNIGWGGSAYEDTADDGTACARFELYFYWTTNKSQEDDLAGRISYVKGYLCYDGQSERDRIMAIHDYVCDHVDYDFEHLSQGADYPLQFSAYAAQVNGKAVCQGYAILFYQIAKEAGLGVRVITSAEHAWNIVRIGSVYYNIDTTWDGQDAETTHDWCLLGMRDFTDYNHIREYPYYTDEFEAAHPMVKDSKMNKDNLSFSFTTTTYDTVTTYASTKPKLLIFGAAITDSITDEFMKAFLDYKLTDINVVFIDVTHKLNSDVREYRTSVGGSEARFCYSYDDGPADACFSFLRAFGYTTRTVQLPLLVFIDTNNKIQNYRIGAQGAATIAGLVKDFLGVTLSFGAPRIVRQPYDQKLSGGTASFTTLALGRGALSYQWYFRTSSSGSWTKCASGGYNTPTYTVQATRSRNGYQYRCAVKNACGTTYTNTVTLYVQNAPVITQQPVDVKGKIGETVTFSVKATGDDLKYQWYFLNPSATSPTWSACSGDSASTDTLSVEVKEYRIGYRYYCKVWNNVHTVGSQRATLKDYRPVITSQPVSVVVAEGTEVQFTVEAEGEGLSYQWYYRTYSTDWTKCSSGGCKTATYTVKATTARDGYMYCCKVSNEYGSVDSELAQLSVEVPPTITTQPVSTTVDIGSMAVFRIRSTGAREWHYRTSPIDSWTVVSKSVTAINYMITASKENEGWQFYCKVSNRAGSVDSDVATLFLNPYEAPSIALQPASVTASAEDSVTFGILAKGGGLSYQWQYRKSAEGSWNSCSNGKEAALTVEAKTYRAGYQYRCKVTNSYGTTYTEPATLQILPLITQQPTNQSAAPGETVSFSVKAEGAASYQWQFRKTADGAWSNCSGGTAASFSVEAKSYRNGYQYRCKVTNAAGTVYSEPATLTVLPKPTITLQPQSVTAAPGETVQFTVAAEGAASYQWQFKKPTDSSWSSCSGGTAASFSVEAKSYRDGYQYRCRVTNAAGAVYSDVATLTVLSKPTITAQPQDQTAAAGETVQFTVAAEGAVSYQWQFKKPTDETWSNCSNGTEATLSVEAKAYRNGYQYRCRVTNAAGTTISEAATLTVS